MREDDDASNGTEEKFNEAVDMGDGEGKRCHVEVWIT
jgi:hypothetical protein